MVQSSSLVWTIKPMSRTKLAPRFKTDRAALRRRVLHMIRAFNAGRWEDCFASIDPKLRAKGQPDAAAYGGQLQRFQQIYGRITPWHTRISLHLDVSKNKLDPRQFAFVYVVWKDASNEFHMFRERWVKEQGEWYTRVVGLVPSNVQEPTRLA
jgi:hypothetical protein